MTASALDLPGIALLRTKYVAAHHLRHDEIAACLADIVAGTDTAARLKELQSLMHRISGTAGSFGFGELGATASEIEYMIDAYLHGTAPGLTPILRRCLTFLDMSETVCTAQD